ncbi:hypothetical protein BT96DRAFT_836390 [Gymnopus androsaceus JB14]|uniref:Uncharacterized protein n=1 Tax=Gymnopus androsaceus JB14 TaxID=1447944 RepID=A0A6A4GT48_9AGAR|nr:hypothetical protein BT96DRAFT_836390 [Gymnopus androsaceus JB14]
MSFNTLLVGRPGQQSIPSARQKFAPLGARPSNFAAGLNEYKAYELHCNDLFRSAHGRVALLAGGVIARLARDYINAEDVYDGPMEDARAGICSNWLLCVWDGNNDFAMWDNKLSEEEIELICGMYEIQMKEWNGTTNVGLKSWWPRPQVWKVSGLNRGYWSPDAEIWFQNRLTNIVAQQYR